MLPREYTREAFKRGLSYETRLGVNPFKFGIVGSTDSHTSLATTQEDNFFGKVVPLEPSSSPHRFDEVVTGNLAKSADLKHYAWMTSASGLAAVWAKENTREALWDAMARKEVYATTGTRLQVRVFGGYDFSAKDLERSDFAEQGYQRGVPMGGDLGTPRPARRRTSSSAPSATPTARTSTASRSSRAGSTLPARRRRRSTTSPGRATASPARTASCPRWATP
jgi:hypothetical protein